MAERARRQRTDALLLLMRARERRGQYRSRLDGR
jgi:hypothetical protein